MTDYKYLLNIKKPNFFTIEIKESLPFFSDIYKRMGNRLNWL